MTVAELIAKLQTCPQDARVIVNGYEGGYCDVEATTPCPIKLNRNTAWYYGPHDEPEGDEAPDEQAILIAKIIT